MANLSPIITELINSLKADSPVEGGKKVQVTDAGSSAGLFYEKLRNAIDYKDEHLLRRNAIERIIRRKMAFGESVFGEGLVKELIWASYCKNNSVDSSLVLRIDKIIQKYNKVAGVFDPKIKDDEVKRWLTGVESAEIEEMLVSHVSQEAFNKAMFKVVRPRVKLPDTVSASDGEVQIFLGVRRSLFKNDLASLRYHLLLSYVPEWSGDVDKIIDAFTASFPKLYLEIEKQIKNPLNLRLARVFQPLTPPFLILREIIDSGRVDLTDAEEVEKSIASACEKKYSLAKKKLGRSIFRSTLYIFLTKMLLAYILEMPADLYFYGKFNAVPFLINISFPPILMYSIGSSIKVPGRENTEKIKKMIMEILYGSGEFGETIIQDKFEVKRPVLSRAFAIIYLLGFGVSFGIIISLLRILHFGVPSGILFVFFLCVVSFFALRIRLLAKELVVTEQRAGVVSTLVDFFMIPFMRVGYWLSNEFSKINIFLFLFDFIIEAPFKAFIDIAEDWIKFLKQKKEEII